MAWQERLERAWYQGHPLLVLLSPLEALYRWVVGYRRRRFVQGDRPGFRAEVPVLVVGNITLGGTGKTPLILWLIEHCRSHGLKVGVVSRGYGANPPHLPWFVQPGQSAALCGDEPLLIVERTHVPLCIDPNRSRAVQALLASESLDLILSDDGLQHYRLARDLELVVIDAQRGLGNGHCLPAGPLREPAERLSSVDAVLYNGALEDSLEGFAYALQPTALVELLTGKRLPLSHLPAGLAVHAVAGIGHPQRFFSTLEKLHWQPVVHAFADHASYAAGQFEFTPRLPLVMTEKDAVKCRAFAQPDWYYLEVQAQPSAAFVRWFDDQLVRLLPHHPSLSACLKGSAFSEIAHGHHTA